VYSGGAYGVGNIAQLKKVSIYHRKSPKKAP
jgi:hypothetical protein